MRVDPHSQSGLPFYFIGTSLTSPNSMLARTMLRAASRTVRTAYRSVDGDCVGTFLGVLAFASGVSVLLAASRHFI